MRGGHNRKTTRAKRLAGTLRRDRSARVISIAPPPPKSPRPPLWLKPVAVAKWNELAPKLLGQGLLNELTVDILANACMHWEMCVRCYHRISRDGPVVKSYRGGYVKHPAMQVLRENSLAFRECLVRMGMTPADAKRVSAREPEDEDDAFFSASSGR